MPLGTYGYIAHRRIRADRAEPSHCEDVPSSGVAPHVTKAAGKGYIIVPGFQEILLILFRFYYEIVCLLVTKI